MEELADEALEVAAETGDPIGEVLDEILQEKSHAELEGHLIEKLESPRFRASLPLHELASGVLARTLDRETSKATGKPKELVLHATWRRSLARRQHALGLRREAIETAETAAAEWRRLVSGGYPGRTSLAETLVLLASALATAEESARAEDFARESVTILESVEGFDVLLAQALVTWSEALSDIGRVDQATEALDKAVTLWRRLARRDPMANEGSLATALMDQGILYSIRGEFERALAVTREGVDLLQSLAAERPDIFEPVLARALHGLGNRYDQLDLPWEALKATEEALKRRRKLSEARADAFRADLARSLVTLGNRFKRVGRHAEALAAAQEAVQHLEILARDEPGTFLPVLAEALDNLSNRQSWMELFDESVQTSERSVALWAQQLQRAELERYAIGHGGARVNLGVHLLRTGNLVRALEEARAAHDELRKHRADQMRPLLTRMFTASGVVFEALYQLGHFDEASAIVDHHIEEVERWYDHDSGLGSLNYAKALERRSRMSRFFGRLGSARRDIEKAVALLSQDPPGDLADLSWFYVTTEASSVALSLGRPDEALRWLERAETRLDKISAITDRVLRYERALLHRDRGAVLHELGKYEESLGSTAAALRYFLSLHQVSSGDYSATIGYILSNQAATLHRSGDHEAAVDVLLEARSRFEDAASTSPRKYDLALALAGSMLGAFLVSAGRSEQSLPIALEAVGVLERLHKETQLFEFEKGLVLGLMNLALVLDANGQPLEALGCLDRALNLSQQNPGRETGQSGLSTASLLRNRAAILIRLKRYTLSIQDSLEALDIYYQLELERTDLGAETRLALQNLGIAQAQLARFAEAASSFRAAVERGRTETTCENASVLDQLATDLRNLGACLERNQQLAEARTATLESVDIGRRLTAISPGSYEFSLAMALGNLSAIEFRLGNLPGALRASTEALELAQAIQGLGPWALSWINEQREHQAEYRKSLEASQLIHGSASKEKRVNSR